MPLQLPDSDSGAKDYCNNIKECSGVTNVIGETLCDTRTATWWGRRETVPLDRLPIPWYSRGPCGALGPGRPSMAAGAIVSDDYGANASPRIVPLPVINPETFYAGDPNGHTQVVVANIFGFFIEGTVDKDGNKTYGPGKGGQQIGRLAGF